MYAYYCVNTYTSLCALATLPWFPIKVKNTYFSIIGEMLSGVATKKKHYFERRNTFDVSTQYHFPK